MSNFTAVNEVSVNESDSGSVATVVSGALESLSVTALGANINAGTTISGALESIALAGLTATPSLVISASLESLSITEPAANLNKGRNIQTAVENITVSGLFADAGGGWVDDYFGTGPSPSAYWQEFNSGLATTTISGGYLKMEIDSPAATEVWEGANQGYCIYQTVSIPSSGYNQYTLGYGGIGPNTDPVDNLAYSAGVTYLSGIIAHKLVSGAISASDKSYMYCAIGHIGATQQYTVETKSTVAGSSASLNEGYEVFGSGVTHGDIAVEVHSTGVIKFKYRDDTSAVWTYITGDAANDGLTPTPRPTMGTAGDRIAIGIIAYASS